jgi:hypothetical protein
MTKNVSDEGSKILKAINEGPLKIGDKELNCAVLEDGTRIIQRKAVFKAFDRPERGNIKVGSRASNMPSFIDANNLQPFISDELSNLIIFPVKYLSKGGRETDGFKAEIIPLLCEVYLSARDSNILTKRQLPLATASEILVRSLSKVGIIALVDEATGYQETREKDALQRLLSLYLSEERLRWAKMFPDEYYRQLFRLKGWSYNPIDVKRPRIVGKITNEIVYEKLPPGVLDELKRLNPVRNKRSGRREATHHQHLSEDIGQQGLRDHLLQLIAIMRISPNWASFKKHFKVGFPSDGDQLELELDEE